ncbi:MAG: diguanylate cyclase [Oligoflexia bacterium]|nr:diguanylate cyclase [Oligoflexia bacterium]
MNRLPILFFMIVAAQASPATFASDEACVAHALKEFLKATASVRGFEGLSPTERLRLAAQTLSSMETRGRELQHLPGMKVVEYVNARGDRYLKLEELHTDASGNKTWVARELMLDGNTNAFDANSDVGRKLVKSVVERSIGKSSIIFIDVNNLGKVNYFQGGTESGDALLAALGSTIKANLRQNDLFFKTGGDEFVVIAQTTDPAQVKAVEERFVRGIDSNPNARAIFRREVIAKANLYRSIAAARSPGELPAVVRDRLSLDELRLAASDFSALKNELLARQKQSLIDQARYRPSISIGSKVLLPGDTYASAKSIAEQQAAQVKLRYKQEIGLDAAKYGGTGTRVGAPNLKAKPVVLDPVIDPESTHADH